MTTPSKQSLMRAIYLPVATLLIAGCETKPERLSLPGYDVSAGRAAVAAYDTNKDGKISGNELPNSPALNSALVNIDLNQDGAITAGEIDARIQQWQTSRVALIPVCCKVRLDGKPAANARLTLEPEAFLGNSLSAAHGVCDQDGVAILSISTEQLPNPRLTGVTPGLYRIVAEIEKDGVSTRYTKGPRTGCEVASDAPWVGEGIVTAEFTTR